MRLKCPKLAVPIDRRLLGRKLEALFAQRGAVFAIDGPSPRQFDYDAVYEPHVGAAELLLGRNRTFPEGWRTMTPENKLDAFLDLLPSLGIHFLGHDASKSAAENKATVADHLSAGARAFIDTLQGGTYDAPDASLDAELVLFRASERGVVRMLNDADAAPTPHCYAWLSRAIPNATVVDCPANHMHMLLDQAKVDLIRATVLANVDPDNRS